MDGNLFKLALDDIKASKEFKEKAVALMLEKSTGNIKSRGLDMKDVSAKLTADTDIEPRHTEKVLQKNYRRYSLRRTASAAAGLIILLLIGTIGYSFAEKRTIGSSNNISASTGIRIPKIQLTEGTNAYASMIGLIVYQGRIYTQCGTRISPEMGEKLKGDKLGTTKGNIDELSKQSDYAVEFASNISNEDVYSVKGYDTSFRIMSYDYYIDGTLRPQFFECLNGITVNTGADVFSKLKIENNIKSAKYEMFDSWNNDKQQYQQLKNLEVLKSFAAELKNTIPFTYESRSYLYEAQGDANQKFVYITLNDGSEVELRLFKDGYIWYRWSQVVFKMENETFNKLWNILK